VTKPTMTQQVTVVALLAAAVFGPGTLHEAGVAGALIFGIGNALLALPGTRWVRLVAICGAMVALLWPAKLLVGLGILAWLAWPPAFLVAWALGSPPRMDTNSQQSDSAVRSRIALAAIILAVALASIAFRLFVVHRLEQTAALFIGIPTLLAIVVVVVVSPRSATGVAVKAATVGLLVSLLFLGEGMLCIAMSAPLFLLIAIACARVGDCANRQSRSTGRLLTGLFVLTAVPMSLEGVTSYTTLERNQTMVESRIVRASADAVGRAILESPRFDRPRPLYLRAGFPTPVATRIESGTWVIRFRGGEMRVDGLEPRIGDLVMKLEESRPGFVRWTARSDSSHMTHFLTWQETSVRWEPADSGKTRVTVTIKYRRNLDPAWYFGPWERYAVRLAAGYLIEAVATP
jgi:MFS family permease